ncbi:hypothetical protein AB6A40_001390 [Gnathostoma spinigerum]|uniref:NADH dehydrogenase subunit 4 n=1 Tax=Gnathostoma spinigerum TaxID=75299 RepID=A0ABD6EB90_9BILA
MMFAYSMFYLAYFIVGFPLLITSAFIVMIGKEPVISTFGIYWSFKLLPAVCGNLQLFSVHQKYACWKGMLRINQQFVCFKEFYSSLNIDSLILSDV